MNDKKKQSENDTQTAFEGMAEQVEQKTEAVVENVSAAVDVFELELEACGKVLAKYVRKNPLKATAIAAVAGLFIGKFLGK